ncbi:MAG TPA: hypothetical protein VEI97_14550 [bacterium]|nr:hypothetical protein [bacterium]
MRHAVPDALRSPGDAYITEGWVVAHWLRQTLYQPPPELLVWDPAACGVAGWAIGRALGLAWDRPFRLSDIRPQGPGVEVESFPTDGSPAPRPEHDGPVLLATNPPFSDLSAWIVAWRRSARLGDAMLLVSDSGALTTAEPRAYGMAERVQPCKRMAFGLTSDDADHLRRLVASGERAPQPISTGNHKTGPTGEGMPSTGKAHCLGLWTWPPSHWSGSREVCEPVIPADLWMGDLLMQRCAEAVGLVAAKQEAA